jgi:hypothetical protein
MHSIELPAHAWSPRRYQWPLWTALEGGCKRAVAVWHRRAGKDEMALNWAAVAAHRRTGNYWHMLPLANQARRAIWDAVDPHTGRRRIDQAFPHEVRELTRENEMLIRFKCGSTWQVVGSDNYNALVGSPPVGIVFSEFALANPEAWAYLRPILRENGGWAVFIYTPRGRNHGAALYDMARASDDWFASLLPATETGVFTTEQLAKELAELQSQYGQELGRSLFEQEYLCSFDSAILGAVYAGELRKLERAGRITQVSYDPMLPVHTAWDLGRTDATSIWFFQVAVGEVRVIDFYETTQQTVQHFAEQVLGYQLIESGAVGNGRMSKYRLGEPLLGLEDRRQYSYGTHYLPHDAAHKLLAARGLSVGDQLYQMGLDQLEVVPATSIENGIQAARKTLERAWFDEVRCRDGLASLRSYHFTWDSERRVLSPKPVHDWSSHASKAFELIAQSWSVPEALRPKPTIKPKFLHETTADELFNLDGGTRVVRRERL